MTCVRLPGRGNAETASRSVGAVALVAGCSASSGPTAAERSICRTVDTLPKNRSPPDYAVSESKQLLEGATPQNTIVFFRLDFVHVLIHSHDPTFQRLGETLQRIADNADLVRRLDARCSTLGL